MRLRTTRLNRCPGRIRAGKHMPKAPFPSVMMAHVAAAAKEEVNAQAFVAATGVPRVGAPALDFLPPSGL